MLSKINTSKSKCKLVPTRERVWHVTSWKISNDTLRHGRFQMTCYVMEDFKWHITSWKVSNDMLRHGRFGMLTYYITLTFLKQ